MEGAFLNGETLYRQLEQAPELKGRLFRYGYLIVEADVALPRALPALADWRALPFGDLRIWLHPEQRAFFHRGPAGDLFLIGHCYDPFAREHREEACLAKLSAALEEGEGAYCRALSDLTGVFLTGFLRAGELTVYGDAAGMLMTYYGLVDGRRCLSSHAQLLGGLFGLEQSPYVRALTGYRYYPLFGLSLPGDLSPYTPFRRLVPDHRAVFSGGEVRVERFWPVQEWDELAAQGSPEERAAEIARILTDTMALIPKKWARPAISVTGGCDSKTTLACTVGSRDRYQYFSYVSQPPERVDAQGAGKICARLGLPHRVYEIPEDSGGLPRYGLQRDLIAWNTGDIGYIRDNEARKRVYLAELDDFDVEVKSWCSEIARAYFCKRFAKTRFPKEPTARYLTTLYKVFLQDRRLVRQTDAVFGQYLRTYLDPAGRKGWPWQELFFWEFRVSAWNGLVITGEHRYAFDITIPYNNRRLLERMLTVPQELRVRDGLYALIRQAADPEVDRAGVAVANVKHTSRRAKLERAYLEIHARLPF